MKKSQWARVRPSMTATRLLFLVGMLAALVGCGSGADEQSNAADTGRPLQAQPLDGESHAAIRDKTPASEVPGQPHPEQYRQMVAQICRATPLSDLPYVATPEAPSGPAADRPPTSRSGEGDRNAGNAQAAIDEVGGELRAYVGSLSRRIDLLQRRESPASMRAQIELLIDAMERLRDLILSEVANVDEKTGIDRQLDGAVRYANRLSSVSELHGCEVELVDPATTK